MQYLNRLDDTRLPCDAGTNAQDPTQPAFNVWENYAVTIDTVNNFSRVYKNGILVAADVYNSAPLAFPMVFGHNENLNNNNEQWDGLIDDIQVYDRILSTEEIVNIATIGDEPVIDLVGNASYTENSPPVRLVTAATVTDPNDPNFGGGKLTVSVSQNANIKDVLQISPNGAGPRQISLAGTNVLYGGVQLGTFTGGNGTPLVISLNSTATSLAVQDLVKRIAFRHAGDNPGALTRQVSFMLNDGLVESAAAVTSVAVTPVNDRPIVNLGGTLNYRENQPGRVLSATAVVADADSLNFETGNLTVLISENASADDRLEIVNQGVGAGQIGVSGNSLTFGGVAIGSFSGGSGGNPLVVTFNANATTLAVQSLVRTITFRTLGDNPSALSRTIQFTTTDDQATTSNIVTKTVTVTAINDKPILGNVGGTRGYILDSPAFILANSATVSDADSADFAGGVLRVRFTTGIELGNRLEIGGGFSLSGSDVQLGDTTIGTLNNNGGVGNQALLITFNANATPVIAQQLVQSITFRTIEATSSDQRSIEFYLSDGDGAVSVVRKILVNVS